MKFHDYSSRITVSAGMKMSCDTEKPTLAYVINRLCRIVTLSFFPQGAGQIFLMLPCTFKVYLDVITLALNFYHILWWMFGWKRKYLTSGKVNKLSFEIVFIFCGSVLYSIVVQSTVLNKKKLFNMFIYHEAYLTCGMLGKQVLVVTSIYKWVTHSLRCRHWWLEVPNLPEPK